MTDRLVDLEEPNGTAYAKLRRLAEQATPLYEVGNQMSEGEYVRLMPVLHGWRKAANPRAILALLSERQALMAALGCVSPSVWDERYDGDPVFDKARPLLSSSGGDKE